MNAVVMRLAAHALLGRRRIWLLVGLAGLLIVVALLTRWGSGGNPSTTATMMVNFGLGTLLPVMCLLVGTGVIAPEIEDGSVVYLLAKPLRRSTIALSKLVVAQAVALVFTVVPVVLATLIAGDTTGELAIALAVATALASFTYVSVFFAIAILSSNPTIVGLLYAVLWEGSLAGYVPGVRTLSVRQWALAPAESMLSGNAEVNVHSDVSVALGAILIVVVVIASFVVAVRRLARLNVRVAE